MATWCRTHAIKAALVAGFLIILLNLYTSRYDIKTDKLRALSLNHPSTALWPRRTRTNFELSSYYHNTLNGNGKSSTQQLVTQSTYINGTPTLIGVQSPAPAPASVNNVNDKRAGDETNTLNVISELEVAGNSVASVSTTAAAAAVAAVVTVTVTVTTPSSQESQLLKNIMTKLGLNICPPIPPNLNGPVEVDITSEPLSQVELRLASKLLPGGWYRPSECNARDRVAIVVPYRDRDSQIPIFLKNLHPFLMKQQIEYGIFIIEQTAAGQFNRAELMNIGFVEALKFDSWDCFVFHDIDLIPMDDRNLYTCPDQPRHMSVAVNTLGFKLPYSTIFGGVSAMTVKQFKSVNGFSNSFWGWGGEDDDLSNRIKHVGYHIARYPVNVARYTMIKHKKEKANPKRYERLVNGAKRFDSDGLNSLKYKLKAVEKRLLYTWILTEITQETVTTSFASRLMNMFLPAAMISNDT